MTGGFSYIVEMVDQISGPAKSARQTIDDMTGGLARQKGELEKTRAAFAALADQGPVTEGELKKFTSEIAKQESALVKTTAEIRRMVATEEAAAAQSVAAEQRKQASIAQSSAKALASREAELAKETQRNIKASELHSNLQAKAALDAAKEQKKIADKSAADTKDALTKSIANAEKAINIGKETVVAAFGAMGNAARALAAGDAKGAVDGVVAGVASLAKALDLVVPGLGQAVAMIVTIAGGLVGVTVGLVQAGAAFALEAAGAKAAMLGLFDAMGGGVAKGAEVEAMVDKVKAKTGILKDELVGYTTALMAMGETDLGDLETSITALGSATALAGKGGADALLALKSRIQEATVAGQGLKLADKQLASLYKTGANLDDVAKKMGLSTKQLRDQLAAGSVDAAKFGNALEDALIEKGKGPLATFTSQLPNLKKAFVENIGDMFEDVDVAPFLASVKDLFALFSQSSPVGQRLKELVGGGFNYVFKAAGEAVTGVKILFLTIAIKALEAYVAMKPAIKSIREFFASGTGSKLLETVLGALWTVLKSIAVAVLVVVGVFVGLWAIAAVIGITFWTLVGALIAFGATITQDVANAVTSVLGFFGGLWTAITAWVAGAPQAASDFVAGLVNGITAGAANVVGAVGGLASGAVGAFKNVLGINSPSKVMFGHGEDGIAGGVVGGIEAGAPDVHAAMADVAAPPPNAMAAAASSGAAAASPSSSSSSGPISVSVTIAPGAIIAGGANASELLELLTAQLADKLEEILMQLGGAKAT